jgi:hypothetical protein
VDEDGHWRTPNMQTYGGDVHYAAQCLLHIPSSVPAQPLDGGRQWAKVVSEYQKRIDKACKIYKV